MPPEAAWGIIMETDYYKLIRHDFREKRVLVMGDLMVDEYITGKVERISPEAPVPILSYRQTGRSAGGASNVAGNIRMLGGQVAVAGVAGMDDGGIWLRDFLNKNGIATDAVTEEAGRMTTHKTRFATKGQQLLRLDREDDRGICEETQKKLLRYVKGQAGKFDAVILSDYRKGVFANPDFVRKIIALCNACGTMVAVDSKSRDIAAFENADFVKPNNLELEDAVDIRIVDDESFNRAGETYLAVSKAKRIIVTRGAAGLSVFEKGKVRQDFPAVPAQVFDVTGAGDTVISTITLGLAGGLSTEEAAALANIAAGIVIGKRGTATVTGEELLEKIYGK